MSHLKAVVALAVCAMHIGAAFGAPNDSAKPVYEYRATKAKAANWLLHGSKVTDGPKRLPSPWSANHWDKQSKVRVTLGAIGQEEKAFGLDTLGPKGGGQLYTWRGVKLEPGRVYRVRLVYLTTGNAKAQFNLRLSGVTADQVAHQAFTEAQVQSHKLVGKYAGRSFELKSTDGKTQTFDTMLAVTGHNRGNMKFYFSERNPAEGGMFAFTALTVEDIGPLTGWEAPEPETTPDNQLDAYGKHLRKQLTTQHGLPKGLFLLGSNQAKALERITWELNHGTQSNQVERRIVPAEGAPFDKALRVQVKEHLRLDWSLIVKLQGAVADVQKGDRALVSIWLRPVEAEIAPGLVQVRASTGWPHWGRFVSGGKIGQWQQYLHPVIVRKDGKAGAIMVSLSMSQQRQTFDIGGIALIHYGQAPQAQALKLPRLPKDQATYPGMDDPRDVDWRRAAQQRIEKYRKGDLAIKVVDAGGRSVPGAKVHVEMMRHEFDWGNGADLGHFGSKHHWKQLSRVYHNLGAEGWKLKGGTGRGFNQAGFALATKWKYWARSRDKAKGDLETTKVFRTIRWLNEHGVNRVRGHTLMWGDLNSVPKQVISQFRKLGGWKKPAAKNYLLGEIRSHIRQTVTDLKPVIYEWDVANEFIHRMDFEKHLGYDGMVQEVAQWFKIAAEADPAGRWFINDNRMLNAGGRQTFSVEWLYKFTKDLQAAGAKIHGVGLQAHMGVPLAHPKRIYEILDSFVQLDVDVKITEFDLGGNASEMEVFHATTTDDAVKTTVGGAYMADLLTMVFSHPRASGFQVWGFYDGSHWKKDAPLYTHDWKLKPAGKVYIDLVFRQWWTDETVTAGNDGTARLRGFCGDYRITATTNGKQGIAEATLTREGQQVIVTLKSAG